MMGFSTDFGDISVSGVGGVGATKDTFHFPLKMYPFVWRGALEAK